ncbi:Phospholipase ABHD3 [Eumeta japonica]|uniref:Phospholipase ABHD3 n=1 Tax=Eumeta variegata TaxID=151549 RepID=A0A4C1UFE5_EUMVA|nr:Phospholipase ABHD3 [Eumeta japonica]
MQRPRLVGGAGVFRECLERDVPLVRERYWPTPWCVEARLQTVLASVLRTWLLPRERYHRQVLMLADGGQVALDWMETECAEGAPVLLVLPGLTGASQAEYVRCVCGAARALRLRCVVFNNRGLGGLPLTSPRLYCAASHDDLAEVIHAVREAAPGVPLLAVGVSLGGLILGNYLAAHGAHAELHAALIISSPLNVPKGT